MRERTISEKKIRHEMEDTFTHPAIYAAYQPPNHLFTPVTTLPTYHRI